MFKDIQIQLAGDNAFMVLDCKALEVLYYSGRKDEPVYSEAIPLHIAVAKGTVEYFTWRNDVHAQFMEWYHHNINNLGDYNV